MDFETHATSNSVTHIIDVTLESGHLELSNPVYIKSVGQLFSRA